MFIFGSSALVVSFIPHGLIDEYRIMVNPVFLGAGNPLLKGIQNRVELKLVKTKLFKSGNVLIYYEPAKNHQAD
jgi:dihydrofolate reductase